MTQALSGHEQLPMKRALLLKQISELMGVLYAIDQMLENSVMYVLELDQESSKLKKDQ